MRAAIDLDSRSRAVGTTIFLGSWMILFVGLLLSCVALCSASGSSARVAAALPLSLPVVATALLLLSSLVLHRGFSGPAAGAGASFLLVQLATWHHLHAHGWSAASHIEAAALYTLTIFHAVHVAVGVVGLAWVRFRSPAMRQFWAAYWHTIGLAWLLLCAWIYLS